MDHRRKECAEKRNTGENCKDLPTAVGHEREYVPEAGTGQQELLITKVRAQNCEVSGTSDTDQMSKWNQAV